MTFAPSQEFFSWVVLTTGTSVQSNLRMYETLATKPTAPIRTGSLSFSASSFKLLVKSGLQLIQALKLQVYSGFASPCPSFN